MGLLSEIQDEAARLLAADERLSGVDILTERLGDLENQIAIRVGKIGLAIVVITPDAQVRGGSAPGPLLNPINIVVEVAELPAVNRGPRGRNLPAADAAETVAAVLHAANRRGTPPVHPLEARRIRLVPSKGGTVIYHVVFTASGVIGASGASPLEIPSAS